MYWLLHIMFLINWRIERLDLFTSFVVNTWYVNIYVMTPEIKSELHS